MPYIVARMKEASSWSGIAVIALGALHISASPELVNAALGVIVAVGGLLAVLLPSKSA